MEKKDDLNALNPQVTVEIEGNTYIIQKSKRAQIVWEMMFKKSIFKLDPTNEGEVFYLLYQLLKCKNKNFDYSFESFIDLADDESTFDGVVLAFNKLNEDDEVKKK
ncbi:MULTISPECIES: hypothetical protein [unclassified Carboxylicivirga]|uniref:hypothetical protein n=1 Tax=Carboxylicivirga TaxID=1628153 RepID=UPI003D351A50